MSAWAPDPTLSPIEHLKELMVMLEDFTSFDDDGGSYLTLDLDNEWVLDVIYHTVEALRRYETLLR